ncbi:hypothetical protein BA1DRAFT_00897 [Photorhabdus aegyptia]|uniref:Uncharacterized protein n=1 Tax=Photorhabdus aegyptia TaxID=2805098 RepID=A0A022PNZ3_9GAMM|nr:hypothetical protein BA1DRAFT_00897 [Photorhabdus aegyptia]
MARNVFHRKRGELRQAYREGQEDYPVQDEDMKKLSPLQYGHINMQGRYFFAVPEAVSSGELRPFNKDG